MSEEYTAGHHALKMEDRKMLALSGVTEVVSFDEMSVVYQTTAGMLTIEGEGLHITRLDLDRGESEVSGQILSLDYSERRERGGFFRKK